MSNEREAFYAYGESIGVPRLMQTCGELKSFQAGAEWQRSQQSTPAGYVLVPVEPTEPILDVLYDNGMDLDDQMLMNVWEWLLAAAPKAEPQPSDDVAKDSRIKELEKVLTSELQDAARYRWLCEYGYFRAMSMDMGGNHSWTGSGRHIGKGESIDAAIDAAMAGGGE